MKKNLLILLMILSQGVMAESYMSIYRKAKRNPAQYPRLVRKLINNGFYYGSIPLIKEYLISGASVKDREVDNLIDRVVSEVGTKQFEGLPESALLRTSAPTIRYIVGKKFFKKGQYDRALSYLNRGIPAVHPSKPFASMIQASIHTIKGNEITALDHYRRCINAAKDRLVDWDHPNKKRQYAAVRDYCTVGVARLMFNIGKFGRAEMQYLELDKRSYIWPEILYEEAWNSFWKRNYNRTLGKLVTYNAPVFRNMLNPEVNVLQALTYLEMCLWDDANTVVSNFNVTFEKPVESVGTLLKRYGRNYKEYYLLAKNNILGQLSLSPMVDRVVSSIVRDHAYIEMMDSFVSGKEELELLKTSNLGSFKKILSYNVKSSMIYQRDLIGAYIKSIIVDKYKIIRKSLKDMANIRLEILSQRKRNLYAGVSDDDSKRGDLVYLDRNSRQYFWGYNGEFWADELGDYVFALKSECR